MFSPVIDPIKLSNIIRSNLVEFFGKPLNAELIETLTKQLEETISNGIGDNNIIVPAQREP